MSVVLVTGAGGFVGRHLVPRLRAEGHAVRAMVRSGQSPDAIAGDVADSAVMAAAVRDVDVVIHLAGKVHDLEEIADDGSHAAVTVGGMRALVDALPRERRTRVVFTSSLAVHGSGEGVRDESAALAPATPYGRAKLEAESILRGASHLDAVILRPAMIYGVGCKGNLPRMVRWIRKRIFPPLPPRMGLRSMLHVETLVDVLMMSMTHPRAVGGTFVVADREPYAVRDLYDQICRALGRAPARWHIPMPVLSAAARAGDLLQRLTGRRMPLTSDALAKLVETSVFTPAKLERELGYAPARSLGDALAAIVAAEGSP